MGINFGELKNSINNTIGMTQLKLKNASPEIFLGLGLITMTGAVVSGIIAARNHDDILTDHEDRLAAAKAEVIVTEKEDEETGEIIEVEVVRDKKEISKAVRKCYLETGFAFVKNYAITGALMGVSAGCFCEMHNIQAGRIAGLTGAYTGLQEYIKRYEDNNIKLNGEESHRMCKYGFKEVEVEEEDPDTGEVVKEKKKVVKDANDALELKDTEAPQLFFEFSKETSGLYSGRADLDYMTIDKAMGYCQKEVDGKGWCTLNEALIYLGMQPTKEGMILGWVKHAGPDVDFGIDAPVNNRFLANYNSEKPILFFNTHGVVWNLLNKKEVKKEFVEDRKTQSRDFIGSIN